MRKEWMRRAVGKVAAEGWWGSSSPDERMLAMTIAKMIEELRTGRHRAERKRIEIRWEEKRVRARFIHILRRPEAGCLTAIMLPEAVRS